MTPTTPITRKVLPAQSPIVQVHDKGKITCVYQRTISSPSIQIPNNKKRPPTFNTFSISPTDYDHTKYIPNGGIFPIYSVKPESYKPTPTLSNYSAPFSQPFSQTEAYAKMWREQSVSSPVQKENISSQPSNIKDDGKINSKEKSTVSPTQLPDPELQFDMEL